MTEMLNKLAERMIIKMRMINIDAAAWATDDRRFWEPRPLNKFDHELRGMVQAAHDMGIETEFEWDDAVVNFTAVTLMGKRYEV